MSTKIAVVIAIATGWVVVMVLIDAANPALARSRHTFEYFVSVRLVPA